MGNELMVSEKQILDYLSIVGQGQGLSENEKLQFIEICKAFSLNPFKKEIYFTKYGQNSNIIVGYETYIKRAERTGRLSGWKAWTEGSGKDLVGKIEIYRKDFDKPFEWEVYYDEYVQITKDGQPNKFWREKPKTMLKKVAISQAFRLCFSEELSGLPYTSEELTGEETLTIKVIEEPKEQKALVQEVFEGEILKDNMATLQQKKMLFAITKNKGINTETLKKMMKQETNKESTNDLTKTEISELIKIVENCPEEVVSEINEEA